MKVLLHSTGDASSLAALLLPQIFPIFSVAPTPTRWETRVGDPGVAPCPRGASPVSVRRQTFTTGCSTELGIHVVRSLSRLLWLSWQPVVPVRLHSASDASPLPPHRAGKRAAGTPGLAALLLPQIFPIFSVLGPCQAGAAPRDLRHESL